MKTEEGGEPILPAVSKSGENESICEKVLSLEHDNLILSKVCEGCFS